ncbi:nephrin [Trichonephila inaurata madagascariensis]|uniref:Nephrin n=1 Tax=Trichonephila inaurata madagascariensis TaxID=2747483 RepID=A0A8X6MKG2_9ARAC|nr:nephrin [Trichonephila inaurata madagascariensis]
MNISCNAYAEPEDLIFLWSLENSQGIINLQNWSSWHMLSYSVTDYGYGTLSCWGKNSIGVQEYPCQFKLQAAKSIISEETNITSSINFLIVQLNYKENRCDTVDTFTYKYRRNGVHCFYLARGHRP